MTGFVIDATGDGAPFSGTQNSPGVLDTGLEPGVLHVLGPGQDYKQSDPATIGSEAIEFLPADFRVMNSYTGSDPESFQTFTVLIVKFLRRTREGESEGSEIYGKRMLVNDTVKENLGGKTNVVEKFRNEEDRIAGLERWFGIRLTNDEVKGISGWKTELK